MSHEERAEALESYMMAQLGGPSRGAQPAAVRRGMGVMFGGPTPSGLRPDLGPLPALPQKPALVDFFRLRFMPHTVAHMLQSANHARENGEPEETVFACLLHDIAVNLIKSITLLGRADDQPMSLKRLGDPPPSGAAFLRRPSGRV
jgi:hypothetical protein